MKQSQLPLPDPEDDKPLSEVQKRILQKLCNGIAIKNLTDPESTFKSIKSFHLKTIRKKLKAKTTYQACAIYASKNPEIILERK